MACEGKGEERERKKGKKERSGADNQIASELERMEQGGEAAGSNARPAAPRANGKTRFSHADADTSPLPGRFAAPL